MKFQFSKSVASTAVILFLGVSLLGVRAAQATPTGPTVLVKKITTTFQTGKKDTFNCAIHTDGVVVERSIAGVLIQESHDLSMSGDIEPLIQKAAGMVAISKTGSGAPMGESYSFLAATSVSSGAGSGAGSGAMTVLQSYDHETGVSTSIEDVSAYQLVKIANTLCPSK